MLHIINMLPISAVGAFLIILIWSAYYLVRPLMHGRVGTTERCACGARVIVEDEGQYIICTQCHREAVIVYPDVIVYTQE